MLSIQNQKKNNNLFYNVKEAKMDLQWKFDEDECNSTAEKIASHLRNLILNGTLKPGTKLKEMEICNKMHVSRTPLREAFRMLQSEKLLIYTRFAGVSVAPISAKFVEDSWELRGILECYAAKMVVFNATKAEIGELYRLKEVMLNVNPNDIETFNRLDREFHMTIAHLSGNQELENSLIRIWDNSLTLRIIANQNKNRIPNSCKEHAAIIQAIYERDARKATRYMQEHFEKSKIDIFENQIFKDSSLL